MLDAGMSFSSSPHFLEELRSDSARLPQTIVENIMAYHANRTTEHRPVVSKDEARQGVTGHNVRYVLGFSLAAIIIAFTVLYVVYIG